MLPGRFGGSQNAPRQIRLLHFSATDPPKGWGFRGLNPPTRLAGSNWGFLNIGYKPILRRTAICSGRFCLEPWGRPPGPLPAPPWAPKAHLLPKGGISCHHFLPAAGPNPLGLRGLNDLSRSRHSNRSIRTADPESTVQIGDPGRPESRKGGSGNSRGRFRRHRGFPKCTLRDLLNVAYRFGAISGDLLNVAL